MLDVWDETEMIKGQFSFPPSSKVFWDLLGWRDNDPCQSIYGLYGSVYSYREWAPLHGILFLQWEIPFGMGSPCRMQTGAGRMLLLPLPGPG